MMIHDDHIAFQRPPAHLGDEAAFIIGTALPQAGLAARVQLGPYLARFGQGVDFHAVAGLGRLFPGGDLLKLIDLLEAVQNRLVAQGVQLVTAEVVCPALHVADAERSQQRFQKGHVAEKKLLLQIFSTGGDDHPLTGAQRRQQVGEGLARTGARFDDQVFVFLQAAFHCPGHVQLPSAELVRKRRAGQHSSGREEVLQRRQGPGGDGSSRQG